MIKGTQYGVAALLLMASVATASPYNKYGRSCKDINCMSSEICVIAQDPCERYSDNRCGSYPTCRKATEAGQQTCTTMICQSGQYCRTNNGVPTCVSTVPSLGYDSAGVSSINGRQINTNGGSGQDTNTNTNTNPFANANAPPANHVPNYAVHSETNQGYPAYPVNSGNAGYPAYPNSGNAGYPSYPANPGTNAGYPANPSNSGNYYGSAGGYPSNTGSNQAPVYPNVNHQAYPGQNPNYNTGYQPNGYPNQHKNTIYYKRNSGVNVAPTVSVVFLCVAVVSRFFS